MGNAYFKKKKKKHEIFPIQVYNHLLGGPVCVNGPFTLQQVCTGLLVHTSVRMKFSVPAVRVKSHDQNQ